MSRLENGAGSIVLMGPERGPGAIVRESSISHLENVGCVSGAVLNTCIYLISS